MEEKAFKLPRLMATIDCAPIGYPGLLVEFWLNLTYDGGRVTDDEWREAEAVRAAEEKRAPVRRTAWETDYYHDLSRLIERVIVPGTYMADGEPLAVRITDGKALYDLLHTSGFEQMIVVWAASQYHNIRQERLRTETKN